MTLPHRADTIAPDPAFAGFWMGGYEGADHVNGHGQPLDLVRDSGHLDRLEEDHRRAAQAGLRAVRESIGWRLAESADGRIDLTRALRVQASARRHGLQVLWTLVHYGLPEGLQFGHDALVPRLARFAAEVVRVLAPGSDRPLVITPINEIGFLAWAVAQTGLIHGARTGLAEDTSLAGSSRVSGYAVKRRLALAALAAMRAMREIDPRVRFLHVEPLVHVVAPHGRPDLVPLAEQVRSWQWQAWDLIAGRLEPALGGAPAWLDLVGVNHYHDSQWEVDTEARLPWHLRDPLRRPLRHLLSEAAQRYGRPLVVAETSHVGIGRADWLHDIAAEVRQARDQGVPVQGLCVYPLVDRPDWQEPQRWHRSGLWHVETPPAPPPARPWPRHGERMALRALRDWQRVLPGPAPALPVLLVVSAHRWDGPRRRTRALLEPLAIGRARWRLVVVEPPRHADVTRLDVRPAGPCIDVLVPHTPLPAADAHEAQLPLVRALVAPWLAEQGIQAPLAWIDAPHQLPLALRLEASRVVADRCGTVEGLTLDLSGALPDGVDGDFLARRSRRAGGWPRDEWRRIAPPPAAVRLVFAGALDRGLNWPLITALAEAQPGWQILLAGEGGQGAAMPPSLPPNVQVLADLPHELLAECLATAHAALLPRTDGAGVSFALQALAAGLPLVVPQAMALPPQAQPGVRRAATLANWLAALQAALAESPRERQARQRAARARLRTCTWRALACRLDAELRALPPRAFSRDLLALSQSDTSSALVVSCPAFGFVTKITG